VDGVELDLDAFRSWREEYSNAEFILEDGKYICGTLTEKMSKRLYNTVNPDDLVHKYGADTFRMYEMFLGPVEMSNPWDTKGIEGVHRFLKKLWRLFFDELKGKQWNEEKATEAELKVAYHWKVGNEWNTLSAIAVKEASLLREGSAEEFITEHYWGYIKKKSLTGEYEVSHPKWNIHQVKEYEIKCNTAALYGATFEEALNQPPQSVFLAEGSAIQVMKGKTVCGFA
jgi:hypothetical protein